MNDASLLEELKAILSARKREDPLIIAMSADVKKLRTAQYGQSDCVNLALGNSRSAVSQVEQVTEDINALRSLVMVQADTITELQAALATAVERLDKASVWLKTKGMQ